MPGGPTAAAGSGAASAAAGAEADELAYVRGLYDGIGALPRAMFIRRLGSIASATDSMSPSSADDLTLLAHLQALGDMLQEYLKPSTYEVAPAPAPAAGASAAAVAAAAAAAPTVVAAPGVMAPARVPSLIHHNPEFTQYFFDNTLPSIVRNLLGKHYNSYSMGSSMHHSRLRNLPPINGGAAPSAASVMPERVNKFMQTVLRVIAKHMSEPTVPMTLLLPVVTPPTPAGAASSAAGAAPGASASTAGATVPAGVVTSSEPTSAGSAPAAAVVAPAPQFVSTKVTPLFPDSVCANLIGTLLRIFDKDKTLYSFYDKPATIAPQKVQGFETLGAPERKAGGKVNAAGEGEPEGAAVADPEAASAVAVAAAAAAAAAALPDPSELNNDDEVLALEAKEQEASARALGDAVIRQQFGMTLEEHLLALAASRRDRLAQRERAREDRLKEKITQLQVQGAAFKQPVYQYSAVTPGAPAFGLLQSNIQCFGMHGGFDVMLERLSVGFNARIDSRVPVAARRGHNPAQGSREPFYQRERERRVRFARSKLGDSATAEEISALIDPPIIQGSFPSIAPYLTKNSFVTPPPGGLTRIPLHRGRMMLDPLLKLVQSNLLSQAFYPHLCAHVKDVMIIRLLHLQADESRLCDKAFLTNLLQEYVWRFIKHLSVHHQALSWDAVKWPMLENDSMVAYQALAQQEKAAAEAASAAQQGKEVPLTQILLPTPPPDLFELNLNADEVMEAITIKLSYHLFISPLLEKRINGLQDLNHFIELTNVRARLDAAIAAGRPEPNRGVKVAVTAWLNQTVLSNYLLDIRILDDIAGPYPAPVGADAEQVATHPQLLQRSDVIVRYLSRLGKLQDNHLRQIWSASIGKHESVENAVYSLLASVARTLTFPHIRLLLCECVATVPYAQWNSRTLKLLSELARAHEKEESLPLVGALAGVGAEKHPADVKIAAEQESVVRIAAAQLWSILTLPHVAQQEVLSDAASAAAQLATPASAPSNASVRVSFSLRQQCAAQLATLLSKPSLEPLRREYIVTIMGSVQARKAKAANAKASASGSSIALQLWLLSGLLHAYSVSQNALNENPRWKMIQTFTPLGAFVEEIAAYAAAARENLPTVLATLRKRVGPRRRVPDAALLVLTGSPLEPAGDAGRLGIGLAELDSTVTLPVCLENSAELLDSMRHDSAAYAYNSGAGAAGAHSGGAAASTGSAGGASASRASAAVSATSVPYSEALSHELEMLIRLELLRYLAQASFEQFKLAHIDALWGAFGGGSAVSPRAAAQWASWLRWMHVPRSALTPTWVDAAAAEHEELCIKGKLNHQQFIDSSRVTKELADDTAKHIFLNKLCAAPESSAELQLAGGKDGGALAVAASNTGEWAQMDESAFITWRHYFLVVNEQTRHIVLHAPLSVGAYNLYSKHSGEMFPVAQPVAARSGVPPPVFFGVVAGCKTLLGLEQLWSIALHAEQPAVVQLAVDLLIQVYACIDLDDAPIVDAKKQQSGGVTANAALAAQVSEWRHTMREKFLAKCMELLKNSAASASTDDGQTARSSTSNPARILRCLNLLQSFMLVVDDEIVLDEGAAAFAGVDAAAVAPGTPFTVLVRLGSFSQRPDDTVSLTLQEGWTVRQAKEELATLLNVRASTIGMVALHAQPARELLNYELVSASLLVPAQAVAATDGAPQPQHQAVSIALRPASKLSNVNHPENLGRMPGEEKDDEEEEAALQLARNFTPATPGPGAAAAAFPSGTPATAPAPAQQGPSRAPMHVLANRTDYFETLFSLLPSKGARATSPQAHEISQRVWKLLTSLPTNQRLLDEMKQLSGIPSEEAADAAAPSTNPAAATGEGDAKSSAWARLLDPESPYKLLYSLRIISKLAQSTQLLGSQAAAAIKGSAPPLPSAAATKTHQAGIAWRNRFLRLGGAQYLYSVLRQLLEQRAASIARPAATAISTVAAGTAGAATVPTAEWDVCRNSCLTLLLELFTFFVLTTQAQSNVHVLHLLPDVLPRLPAAADPFAPPNEARDALLQNVARGLHSEPAFLSAVNFAALTSSCLRLMADCARSVSRTFRNVTHHSSHPQQHAAASKTSSSSSNKPAHSTLAHSAYISARSMMPSTAGATSDAQAADVGSQDDALIRPAMTLLSACVLHRATGASAAVTDASQSPLGVLMSTPNMPTLFSTLFFLCPPGISQEQGEAWLSLAVHSRQQVEAEEATGQQAGSAKLHALALHRFLFQDILLLVLSPVCAKTQYASAAQDFFGLLVLLARDLLEHELRVAPERKVMPGYDWTDLFQRTVISLKARPILESKNVAVDGAAVAATSSSSRSSPPRSVECDHVLIGLLNLVRTLLHLQPALKELAAARPKFSHEAEELMLGNSAAQRNTTPTAGSAAVPATSSLSSSSDVNPAAGLVLEVFFYLFDLPSMRSGGSGTGSSLPPPPKAKRRQTRLAAFHLLLELAREHRGNFVRLCQLLLTQNLRHNSVALSNEHEYESTDYDKSSCGYVGLTNLSATCYLNSMMVQLFMMPDFRQKVLAVDTSAHVAAIAASEKAAAEARKAGAIVVSPTAPPPPGSKAGAPADGGAIGVGADNLLYQLQLLFGALQEGEQKCYNPASFCRAFRDHSGQPIDVRQQQDVDEFFNALCDKLEAALKVNQKDAGKLPADSADAAATAASDSAPPSVPDLVKETFGGELEHQLLCQDCPHTSFRTEAFCALPLSVSNNPTLQSSLNTFITGEMLEGDNAYKCVPCNKKVRTLKRVVVKSLPQILVLNLKRFSFDFETMMKVKLNDRLSFPLEEHLDMEPFTAEGLARREQQKEDKKNKNNDAQGGAQGEESKEALPTAAPTLANAASTTAVSSGNQQPTTYSLVGILLHSGGSESGHYTSLVKERLPSGASTGKWLEFNDAHVREFDPALIPAEAFGGANVISIYDAKSRKKINKEVEKSRSAYLLIYARDPPPHAAGSTVGGVGTTAGAMSTPQHSPLKRGASSEGKASFGFTDISTSPNVLGSSRTRSPPPMEGGDLSPPAVMPPVRRMHSGPGLLRGASKSGRSAADEESADADGEVPLQSPAFSRFGSLEASLNGVGNSSLPSSPAHVRSLGSGAFGVPLGGASSSGGSGSGSISMPPQIMERIWDENLRFLRNKQLFQPDYFRFLLALLKRAPKPLPADEATAKHASGSEADTNNDDSWLHVQLAITFLTDVLAHAKYATNPSAYAKEAAARRALGEEEELPSGPLPLRMRAMGGRLGWEDREVLQVDSTPMPHGLLHEYAVTVESLLATHLPAARWLLKDVLIPSKLRQRYILFDCGSVHMRDALVDLVGTAMRVLAPYERGVYDQTDVVEPKKDVPTVTGPPAISSASSLGAATALTAQEAALATTVEGAAAGSGESVVTTVAPQPQTVPRSLILQLIDEVMLLWRDLQWQWRSLPQFFGLLLQFAEMGYNERKYLLQVHCLVAKTIDLYLGDSSPWARAEKYRRTVMGDLDTSPNWYNAFALLACLLCSTLTEAGEPVPHEDRILPPTLLSVQHGSVPLRIRADGDDELELHTKPVSPPPQGEHATTGAESGDAATRVPRWVLLSRPSDATLTSSWIASNAPVLAHGSSDYEMVFAPEFVSKLLRDGHNPDAMRLLVAHVAFGHPQADAFVCRTWLRVMDEANSDHFEPLLSLLPPLLQLNDPPLSSERIERYLNPRTGLLFKARHWSNSFPIYTYVVLKFLLLTLGAIEGHPAGDYLRSMRDELYWFLNWVRDYHMRDVNSRVTKPAPAEMQRIIEQQQATMSALVEWFGREYLVERQQREQAYQETQRLQNNLKAAAQQEKRTAAARDEGEAGDSAIGTDPLVAASGARVTSQGTNLRAVQQQAYLVGRHEDLQRYRSEDADADGDARGLNDTSVDDMAGGGDGARRFEFGDEDTDEDDDGEPMRYGETIRNGIVQSPGGSGRFSDDNDDGTGGMDSNDDDELLDGSDAQSYTTEAMIQRMGGLGVAGRGISGGSGGVAPLPPNRPVPALSRMSNGMPWPPGGGVGSLGHGGGSSEGTVDIDEEVIPGYVDDDEDPVEQVRKFEEQEKKARGEA